MGEHAQTAAVAGTARGVGGPGHDKSSAQRRHRRIILITGKLGIHLEFGADRAAGRVIALTKDTVATAVTSRAAVSGVPDHYKTTTAKASHYRAILSTAGFGINLEFAADGRP